MPLRELILILEISLTKLMKSFLCLIFLILQLESFLNDEEDIKLEKANEYLKVFNSSKILLISEILSYNHCHLNSRSTWGIAKFQKFQ